ncbi:hypothetical protein PUN28_006835 [Cardiocondyla obscurior]|uniref:Secreted protein n=1 Tax=Cardiocondyla obscurior TaxID=286306 RepID=A0AAW2G4X8_9HYME
MFFLFFFFLFLFTPDRYGALHSCIKSEESQRKARISAPRCHQPSAPPRSLTPSLLRCIFSISSLFRQFLSFSLRCLPVQGLSLHLFYFFLLSLPFPRSSYQPYRGFTVGPAHPRASDFPLPPSLFGGDSLSLIAIAEDNSI